MPNLPRIRRLELIFESTLDDLSEANLQSVCDGGVAEDTHLEFKGEPYARTDQGRRDLAGDVAAMANSAGGVIVIGVAARDGRAVHLRPGSINEDEELRMLQTIASLTAPVPQVSIRRVITKGHEDNGYYLVAVPRSPEAPHAVRLNDALRYGRRDGPLNRWLSESEVADAYRNRFTLAESQVDRLTTLVEQGVISLHREGAVWATTALVPIVTGEIPIRHATLRDARDRWITPWIQERGFGQHIFVGGNFEVSTGVRCVTIGSRPTDEGKFRGGYAELYTDGAGYAATPVWTREHEGHVPVLDEQLFECTFGVLGILVEHATAHAGASGDALVQFQVVGPTDRTLILGHLRQFDGAYLTQFNSTRIVRSLPATRHSVNLDDGVTFGGRLIITRMALAETFQAFGYPEVPQLTERGELRRRYFQNREWDRVEAFARDQGVPFVETTLEQEP